MTATLTTLASAVMPRHVLLQSVILWHLSQCFAYRDREYDEGEDDAGIIVKMRDAAQAVKEIFQEIFQEKL